MDWLHALIKIPYLGTIILFSPYLILMFIAWKAIGYSIRGGLRRLIGFIGCPILGTICLGAGWWIAYVGFPEDSMSYVAYPVAGWIGMVIGSICILFGTIYSVFGHEVYLKEIENVSKQNSKDRDEGILELPDDQVLYVGDSKTGIYHYKSCLLVEGIRPENIVLMGSAYQAEKDGYTFCDLCKSKEDVSYQHSDHIT